MKRVSKDNCVYMFEIGSLVVVFYFVCLYCIRCNFLAFYFYFLFVLTEFAFLLFFFFLTYQPQGAIKLLEKAVGEERAIEYEERAYKNFELGQARALMLRQSAIERSIAMKRGMKNSGGIMARASAAMRKNIRNRLIETVTGK